jgi:CRAL/TRIO domain
MDVPHIYAMVAFFLLWVLSTGAAAEKQRLELSSSSSCAWHVTRRRNSASKDTKSFAVLEASASSLSSVSSESEDPMSREESSISGLTNDELLVIELPEASSAERLRFLTARGGDVGRASKLLRHYLDWIKMHELIEHELKLDDLASGDDDVDLDHWNVACAIAIKACHEKCDVSLPRVIRMYQQKDDPICDYHGNRIFHIIPALMDDTLVQTSTYALATALYLNRQLDRTSLERVTVCIDVRAGLGWPNIHAVRLVPFMKVTTMLLLSLFPERLEKCLLYPVPSAFLWIWNAMQRCLEPETKEKICLLSGVNKIESPPPMDQITKHLPPKVVEFLESSRRVRFIQ